MIFEYKNYQAECRFDETAGTYYGQAIHIKDVITFVGNTQEEAEKEFRESVDIYLEWCEQEGITPNQPYSRSSLESVTKI